MYAPPNTACTPLRQAQGGLVGLPLRGVRVFKQFAWLEVGSVKVAFPRPTHHRVSPKGDLRQPLGALGKYDEWRSRKSNRIW